MSDDLPEPFVPSEVDLRGMPGFMLNVERLLQSELVALGTAEECWAAFMLWCRAWQQFPAGSLPDDDRILASFSRAGRRWGKVKNMALHGFVRCSDGRLYHKVLSQEVLVAWRKRQTYRKDQDRLQRWREDKRKAVGNGLGNGDETGFNTISETHSETAREMPLKHVDRDRDRDRREENPPKPPLRGGARKRNGKAEDPYHLADMTRDQLRARFNATSSGGPEHEAVRQRLWPGSIAPTM